MNSLSGPGELNEGGVVSVTVTGMVLRQSHCQCEHRDPPELGRACSISDYSVSKIKNKFYDSYFSENRCPLRELSEKFWWKVS